VFLFLDNCRVHHAKDLQSKYQELNIEPVWNVPYHFVYNSACELLWAQWKAHFRPLLLRKMLEQPHPKDPVLSDSVKETIRDCPTTSIPRFILHGLRGLRADSNIYRKIKGQKLKPTDDLEKIMNEFMK
jgi:hypothetical protein